MARASRAQTDEAGVTRVFTRDELDGEWWEQNTIYGVRQAAIARQYGVSQAYVSQRIDAYEIKLPATETSHLRRKRLAQVGRAIDALMPRLLTGNDDDAVKAWVRLADRESRYVGLDAPISLREAYDHQGVVYALEMDDDVRKALQ